MPLSININSDNKVCIPKEIAIDKSVKVISDCYNINEITLPVIVNETEIDETTNARK